jgi:hypothetical protein
MCWKNVDVVRPHPGHAVTWGEKLRSPSDCRTCWATRTSSVRSPSGFGVSETRIVSPIPAESRIESPAVSSYKFEQRRLIHRGREFHFVSYDAQIANERRGDVAMPPMWYLMNEGKRRPVMEQIPGMAIEDLDRALLAWVEAEIYSAVGPRRAV